MKTKRKFRQNCTSVWQSQDDAKPSWDCEGAAGRFGCCTNRVHTEDSSDDPVLWVEEVKIEPFGDAKGVFGDKRMFGEKKTLPTVAHRSGNITLEEFIVLVGTGNIAQIDRRRHFSKYQKVLDAERTLIECRPQNHVPLQAFGSALTVSTILNMVRV